MNLYIEIHITSHTHSLQIIQVSILYVYTGQPSRRDLSGLFRHPWPGPSCSGVRSSGRGLNRFPGMSLTPKSSCWLRHDRYCYMFVNILDTYIYIYIYIYICIFKYVYTFINQSVDIYFLLLSSLLLLSSVCKRYEDSVRKDVLPQTDQKRSDHHFCGNSRSSIHPHHWPSFKCVPGEFHSCAVFRDLSSVEFPKVVDEYFAGGLKMSVCVCV